MRSLFSLFEEAIAILGVEGAIALRLKLNLCDMILNILATKLYEKPVITISF